MTTPAEKAIWDRITRHRNYWRLIRNFPLDTHRYYLAYSPQGKAAVLRLKDEHGLSEWRTRRWHEWRLFPDPPPTIEDVTVQVLEAIERSLGLSNEDFAIAQAWVSLDVGCRIIVGFNDAAPSPTALSLWHAPRHIAETLCDAGPPRTAFHFTPNRAFRWRAWHGGQWVVLTLGSDIPSGAHRLPCPPRPGGPIHGVSSEDGTRGHYAVLGTTVQIEAGSAFEENAILECDAEGRAVARSTGVGVLRALEQAVSGQVVRAMFT